MPAVQHPPGLDLTDRLAHDPAADLDDQAALLQYRDEGSRGDQAFARMIPAQQRLGTDHSAVAEAHDRLVMQDEFAVVERPPQLLDELGELWLHGRPPTFCRTGKPADST